MTMYLYSKRAGHRKAALRRMALVAMWFAALLAASLPAQGQYRAPQEERKTPRALGVLETYKNGTRRLVPVTFFYERHYYDANLYHATPVPLTLYSETLYEVQQYGKKLGNFTVLSATASGSPNAAEWFGNGRFRLVADAATLAKKRPAPVVVEDPSRPVLHRREGSEGDNPPAHPSATATAKPSPDEDDPDRPKLHRRQGSGDGTGESTGTPAGTGGQEQQQGQSQQPRPSNGSLNGAPGTATASDAQTEESSGQDPDRPVLHRKSDSGSGTTGSSTTASAGGAGTTATKEPAAGVVATKVALTPSDDPDHPILRRGKPVQEQGGHDLPDFKKEEPVTRQVAVSDAGPAGASDGQELIYVCREPERNLLEAGARELARTELRRLAAQRGIVLPKDSVAKNVAAKTSSGTKKNATAATAPPLLLQDEQFVPYDLDYNNYATVVFSARYAADGTDAAGAKGATSKGSGATAAGKGSAAGTGQQSFAAGRAATNAAPAAGARGRSWVVTVIAREDSEGKLTKVYSAVSDPRELDLYPEMRLVDAVDPDGYGRQALLFREQKRDGVSWLLGRVVGYDMQTLFETAER
jgi:hypothetical protein